MSSADVSDVLSVQLLQQWTPPAGVISHLLTIIFICLSAVLLHDALDRTKRLNSFKSPSHGHLPSPPPGPWWNLPLIGYLPWLGPRPYVTMLDLSQRYGSVYQVRFGGRTVVVLNGRETIREALVRQADLFAGRPDFPSFAVYCEGRSLAFSSFDADWVVQRKVHDSSTFSIDNVSTALFHHYMVAENK